MSSASTGGTEGSSPASSPASAASLAMAAPKYGTLVPNRIFVGGISASTSEAELAQLFSTYGNVKATKIISDRAGVSKGYGFVTFETEEEAKRLQQESECIVLRERKLNIAPAIKKQPFNRSFDGGSGSPPAVPTNTYYYPNGMGLTYQNGMTFYNTGAPAPATPVAPPTDAATIYQAASVFGPQATAGHQTYAPVMYPCPAPSLYVPQQYPYSPMPYEPYYAGASPAGTPQYLYTTTSSQSTSNGGGSASGGGTNGTGATSPPAGPPPTLASLPAPPQTHHFYAPAAPPPHHHPQVAPGPPQPQVDHLYYSFAAGPPPPPPPHTSIGLADQQLLLYTTDASCQPQQSNDSQTQPQEDSLSTSSHSEQQQRVDMVGNQTSGSTSPLVPFMPMKFPISNRFAASYHPVAIHHPNLHGSQNCLNDTTDTDAGGSVAQMHCRTIVYHPATVYIPHAHNSPFHPSSSGGLSLLPTPKLTSQSHHHHHHTLQSNGNPKLHSIMSTHQRDYSKAGVASTPTSYNVKSQNLSIALISSGAHNHGKSHAMNAHMQKYGSSQSDFHKFTANVVSTTRFPTHQYKRSSGTSVGSALYLPGHRTGYSYHKSMGFGTANTVMNGLTYPAFHKTENYQNFGPPRSGNYNSEEYFDSGNGKSKSFGTKNFFGGQYKNTAAAARRSFYNNSSSSQPTANYNTQTESQMVNTTDNPTATVIVTDKSSSPPPAPYSPMTRPLPTLSPPIPQVQFYAPAQNRYQSAMPANITSSHQHQQQQQPAQRRYSVAPPLPAGRKASDKYSATPSQSSILRQHKYNKPNSLMQPGSGKLTDDSLGGAGDAPPGVGRMSITPPGTPRNNHQGGHSSSDQSQISDSCSHQMQALSL